MEKIKLNLDSESSLYQVSIDVRLQSKNIQVDVRMDEMTNAECHTITRLYLCTIPMTRSAADGKKIGKQCKGCRRRKHKTVVREIKNSYLPKVFLHSLT